MSVNISTESIARASSRRPLRTIGIWVVFFVIAMFLRASLFEDVITTEFAITNDPESAVGNELIEEKLMTGPKGTNEVVIIQSQELTVDDESFQQFVNSVHADVAALGPDIIRQETLLNYFQIKAEFLVSQDRHTTLLPFTMAGDVDDASEHIDAVTDVVDGFKGTPGFKILMTGQATVGPVRRGKNANHQPARAQRTQAHQGQDQGAGAATLPATAGCVRSRVHLDSQEAELGPSQGGSCPSHQRHRGHDVRTRCWPQPPGALHRPHPRGTREGPSWSSVSHHSRHARLRGGRVTQAVPVEVRHQATEDLKRTQVANPPCRARQPMQEESP